MEQSPLHMASQRPDFSSDWRNHPAAGFVNGYIIHPLDYLSPQPIKQDVGIITGTPHRRIDRTHAKGFAPCKLIATVFTRL
jgi:hypothetical protein